MLFGKLPHRSIDRFQFSFPAFGAAIKLVLLAPSVRTEIAIRPDKRPGVFNHGFEPLHQPFDREGFRQKFCNPMIARHLDAGFIGIGGDHDHGDIGVWTFAGCANQLGQIDPGDRLHLVIGEHQIVVKPAKGIETLDAIFRDLDGTNANGVQNLPIIYGLEPGTPRDQLTFAAIACADFEVEARPRAALMNSPASTRAGKSTPVSIPMP